MSKKPKYIRQWCVVDNCESDTASGIAFFRFPRDKERAVIWARAAMRYDLIAKIDKLYASYRVCAAHFEEKHFRNYYKNRLKPDAIPTVFPPLVWTEEDIDIIKQDTTKFFEVLLSEEDKGNLNSTFILVDKTKTKMDQETQTDNVHQIL